MHKSNAFPQSLREAYADDGVPHPVYSALGDLYVDPPRAYEPSADQPFRGTRHRHPAGHPSRAQEDIFYLPWWDFYFKVQEVAEAYLEPAYDHVFYISRGGMSVVHRLAHVLGIPSGGHRLTPLYIQRHTSDSIQARGIPPRLLEPIQPELVTGQRLLLVEDTIGKGATLQCALHELQQHHPQSVDVVTAGLDHAEFSRYSPPELRALMSDLIICFDYWGWMVLPWEMQAADAFQRGAAVNNAPYSEMTAIERRRAWQSCGRYGLHNASYDAQWQQRFMPIVTQLIQPNTAIIDLCPGATTLWLGTQLGSTVDYLPLAKETHLGLFSCPRSSADVIIARNVLPSQLGIHGWQALLEGVQHALKPGGYFIFDYLDRTGIIARQDAQTDLTYFTPQLLARLMLRSRFAPVTTAAVSESSSGLLNLGCFTLV